VDRLSCGLLISSLVVGPFTRLEVLELDAGSAPHEVQRDKNHRKSRNYFKNTNVHSPTPNQQGKAVLIVSGLRSCTIDSKP
jgi:hypothetical protein